MSIRDPQPGDVFFHARFGGGCKLSIRKRGIRKGWGDSVWVYLQPFDGHSVSKPLRTWAMAGWPAFAEELSLERPE